MRPRRDDRARVVSRPLHSSSWTTRAVPSPALPRWCRRPRTPTPSTSHTTGRDRVTIAPGDLATFRTDAVLPRTGLSGNDVGIAPDVAHMSPPAGYHVGVQDLKTAGRYDVDYST